MDVSVVIVNWKSLALARSCVESILRHSRELTSELLVIDNASGDDLSCLPEAVRKFQALTNLGFAGANNFGAERTSGRYILFLNPDTELIDDAISAMVNALDSDAGLGAVGCRLLNPDGTYQQTAVQHFPTIANQLLGLDFLIRRFPTCGLWGPSGLEDVRDYVPNVEVVSGACLMARRSSFEQVGAFSTESFMYGEEADLCFRLQRAGWRVGYVGSTEVVHLGGQSSQQRGSGFSNVMIRRSVFLFLRNARGPAYAMGYRGLLAVSSLIRVICLSLAIPFQFLLRGEAVREETGPVLAKWFWIGAWSMGFWRPVRSG